MIGDKWYEVMEYCSEATIATIQRSKMGRRNRLLLQTNGARSQVFVHENGCVAPRLETGRICWIDAEHVLRLLILECRKCFAILSGTWMGFSLKEKSAFGSVSEANPQSTRYTVSKCSITKEYSVHKLKRIIRFLSIHCAEKNSRSQEYDSRLVDVFGPWNNFTTPWYSTCVPWNSHQRIQITNNTWRTDSTTLSLSAGCRERHEPFEKILEPDPAEGATIDDVVNDEWYKEDSNLY